MSKHSKSVYLFKLIVQGVSIYIDKLVPCTNAKALKFSCFVNVKFICIFDPKIYAEEHRFKVDKLVY